MADRRVWFLGIALLGAPPTFQAAGQAPQPPLALEFANAALTLHWLLMRVGPLPSEAGFPQSVPASFDK